MANATMQYEVTRKGTMVEAVCPHCLSTNGAHEWADMAFNEIRDALESGKYRCEVCDRVIPAGAFRDCGRRWYAARLVLPGFEDATYEFGTNRRTLERQMRELVELHGGND